MSFLHEEQSWDNPPKHSLLIYILLSLIVLWFSFTGDRWVPILDSANLVFHEAGHPLLAILSGHLSVYGGTLMQLAMPFIVAINFYRQRNLFAFMLSGLWFSENLFNVARYMADARAQILPLIGGGEHDWTEIFTRWNVLKQDHLIADSVSFIAVMLIIGLGFYLQIKSKNLEN